MTHPCVSVIMPVYNVAPYLREGASSVLAQTMNDLELILVDDGSTDGSSVICDEIATTDSRVRVVHQPNGGVGAARNAGLDAVTGTYLMFCDPDDFFHPTFCQRAVSILESENVDSVVCRYEFKIESDVSEENVRTRIGEVSDFNSARPGRVQRDTFEKFFAVPVSLCAKIYRMSIVRENGIRFPTICGHEDDAFWFQYAMLSGDVQQIPDRLYTYRMRSGSITDAEAKGRPHNRLDRIKALDFVADFMRTHRLSRSHGRFLVRLAYDYYLMMKPFFSEEELAGLRRNIVRRTSEFADFHFRLVDHAGELVRLDRRGSIADLLGGYWHRLRSRLYSGDRRTRALARAERSFLLWRNR